MPTLDCMNPALCGRRVPDTREDGQLGHLEGCYLKSGRAEYEVPAPNCQYVGKLGLLIMQWV